MGAYPSGSSDIGAATIGPEKVKPGFLRTVMVTPGNGAGSRDGVGLVVGDRVQACLNFDTATIVTSDFESTVTIVDKIQQSGGNYSGNHVLVIALRVS